MSQGSTFEAINSKEIKAAKFWVPVSRSEQASIGGVLGLLDKAAIGFVRDRADLQEQKSSLMQQLLTGKRRLKIKDPAPVAAIG
jgi:type I restriction enzyme S subunit